MSAPKPYFNRLVAIGDMLHSPMQKIREESYRLLYELWREYRDDSDFQEEVEKLAKQNTTMLQEIGRQSQSFDTDFNELVAKLTLVASEIQNEKIVAKREVDKRFYILTDHPNGPDKLNYDQYAQALSELVCNPDMKTPITVGIYGQWGKGKTFLMKKIRETIEKTIANKEKSKGNLTNILTVDFNAWSYAASEHMWAGMVINLYNEVEKHFRWIMRFRRGWKAIKSYWVQGLVFLVLYTIVGLSLIRLFDYDDTTNPLKDTQAAIQTIGAAIIAGSAIITGFRSLLSTFKDFTDSVFHSNAKNLQNLASRPDFREKIGIMADIKTEIKFISDLLRARSTRLVLFIDDLDRCDHKKAVEVLQSIMLLLSDEDGGPFVIFLGIDARVMVHAIEENYGEVLVKAGITGYEYLDKIIQLPFSIPYTNPKELRNYVDALLWASDDEKKSVEEKTSGGIAPASESEMPNIPDKESESEVKIPVTFTKDEREAVLNCAGDFCDNPRKIKRIINMYRLAKILMPKTIQEKEKIVRWLLMTEQWPLHAAWIIHSVEDDIQLKRVIPETPIKEVYCKIREFIHSEKMQKVFSIDYDPTLFEVFIEKEPEFTVLDVLNLLPMTFNLNPAIHWEVENYANRLSENSIPNSVTDNVGRKTTDVPVELFQGE
jgi:Cdc6-like AAA superfamily ATPase